MRFDRSVHLVGVHEGIPRRRRRVRVEPEANVARCGEAGKRRAVDDKPGFSCQTGFLTASASAATERARCR